MSAVTVLSRSLIRPELRSRNAIPPPWIVGTTSIPGLLGSTGPTETSSREGDTFEVEGWHSRDGALSVGPAASARRAAGSAGDAASIWTQHPGWVHQGGAAGRQHARGGRRDKDERADHSEDGGTER